MIINGMDEYQKTCRQKLVDWYNKNMPKIYDNAVTISFENTFVVWSAKTLQNYKCLASTSIDDGIYAEYTFNGDKGELYEDVYGKLTNTCHWD